MRAAMLLLPFAGLLPASTIYSVTDLGAFGGGSMVAFGINSSGMAVGWGQTPTGDQNAFVFGSGGSIQSLAGLPGASDTYAYGINSSGTMVGASYVNGQTHGEIWNGARNIDLGAGVFATGINDPGVVIGGNGHAFMLVNGSYRDLGALPGADWSAAQGINSAGTVVGYGSIGNGMFRGFIWTPGGGMVELGTFGGSNSYATAINGSGEVVGHASLSNGYEHAFLDFGAGMTDLGTLGGGSSYAYGINDSGAIVGYSWLAGGQNPHAFVYVNGVMVDLNSLIPGNSGWELLGAYGINSAGEIVGEGIWNGQAHAFRLDPESGFSAQALGVQPVPDPGTEWLVAIGLGLLLICVWRRRTTSAPMSAAFYSVS
jgi:probable HAF family extracellular repeat protein